MVNRLQQPAGQGDGQDREVHVHRYASPVDPDGSLFISCVTANVALRAKSTATMIPKCLEM